MMTIGKELLKNVRFSNLVNAWVLQAQSFRYCAEFVRKGRNPPVMKGGFISSENAYLSNSAHKIACYMVAHAIEVKEGQIWSCEKILFTTPDLTLYISKWNLSASIYSQRCH